MAHARTIVGTVDLALGGLLVLFGILLIGWGTYAALARVDTHHGGLYMSVPGAAALLQGIAFLLARTQRDQPLLRLTVAHVVLLGALPIATVIWEKKTMVLLLYLASAPQSFRIFQ